MAILEVGRLNGRVIAAAPGYHVDIVRDWKQAVSRWNGGGHGTIFQHFHWLDGWYRAFDTAVPLIAIISDAATDRQVALVPLIRHVKGGIRIVEFADLGVTDYNAPILGFATCCACERCRQISAGRQIPSHRWGASVPVR
jgi:CelD/BcsL family acetyltransferase involved in cellulose biosynthesis